MELNKMIGMIIAVTVSIIIFVSVLVPTITNATTGDDPLIDHRLRNTDRHRHSHGRCQVPRKELKPNKQFCDLWCRI